MKKAIVTGSNGFVGSNVCKRLCADGVKVFAVVKDENEKIDNIEKLDGIEIVYCELDEIETLFDKFQTEMLMFSTTLHGLAQQAR